MSHQMSLDCPSGAGSSPTGIDPCQGLDFQALQDSTSAFDQVLKEAWMAVSETSSTDCRLCIQGSRFIGFVPKRTQVGIRSASLPSRMLLSSFARATSCITHQNGMVVRASVGRWDFLPSELKLPFRISQISRWVRIFDVPKGQAKFTLDFATLQFVTKTLATSNKIKRVVWL